MTSFFDKLSLKINGGKPKPVAPRPIDRPSLPAPAGKPDAPAPQPVSEAELLESQRLDVDIYQDAERVVIIALAAGVDPEDFDVTLDEENDLLSIRGVRKRPDVAHHAEGGEHHEPEGKFLQQECKWEPFFRKVVLPAEVDVVKAEAVFRKGVLIVTLPVLKIAEGRKLPVTEVLTAPKSPS
jgi:HSP20 family molecular chaperone IbpA